MSDDGVLPGEAEQLQLTRDLVRWSETLAAIARTGLGFTQSLYEKERFEEVLHVAADIKIAANEVLEAAEERREREHLIQEWMDSIGVGVPGYVTPKVAIGVVVGNEDGKMLLVQRADSGIWLYPTGWADVGYSPAEVAVKEVAEETGIECEPVQLLAVIDGQRMGFSRFAMYMLLFHCTATGGELRRASAGDGGRRLVRTRRDAAGGGRCPVVGADGVRRDQRRAVPHVVRRRALADLALVGHAAFGRLAAWEPVGATRHCHGALTERFCCERGTTCTNCCTRRSKPSTAASPSTPRLSGAPSTRI